MSKLLLPLLTAVTALTALPAMSQQTKVLTAEKHNEYGLVYSLPTTALHIQITAFRETSKAGPFMQFARHYTGFSNIVKENSVKWTITDVSVEPFGVKGDDDTQYLMQLKPGALTYIGVAADGMLLSINTAPEDTDDDERTQGVSRSGRVLKSGGGVEDYLQYVDMDFVSAQNSMRQAEMVANALMDIRDAKLSLTRGTADNVPTDGRQLELMLSSLGEQEDAMTRAFTGSVTVEEFTASYIYTPEDEGEDILFRLSDFAGFVDADDYSGSPVYIKTEILKEGSIPLDVNGEEKKFPKDGVVYAIPGTARITLSADNINLFSRELEFSQFGTTFGLAPALFTDKKAPSFARFSPVTGALVEIGKVAE